MLPVHREDLYERSHGDSLTPSRLWQKPELDMAFWIRDCDQAWSFFGIPQRNSISINGVDFLSELATLFWLVLLQCRAMVNMVEVMLGIFANRDCC